MGLKRRLRRGGDARGHREEEGELEAKGLMHVM